MFVGSKGASELGSQPIGSDGVGLGSIEIEGAGDEIEGAGDWEAVGLDASALGTLMEASGPL